MTNASDGQIRRIRRIDPTAGHFGADFSTLSAAAASHLITTQHRRARRAQRAAHRTR